MRTMILSPVCAVSPRFFFMRLQTPLPNQSTKSVKKKRRIVGSCLFVLLAISGTPWIIANSPLRDTVINSLQEDPDLTISSAAASFGWFTPASLKEISILSKDHRVKIDVQRFATQKTLAQILSNPQQIGHVEVEQAKIHLKLPLKESESPIDERQLYFTAQLYDSDLFVEVDDDPEPVINLKDQNLKVELKRGATGDLLDLGEFVLFDHQELTQEICDEFLQLIDPVLADVAKVNGSVSCQFESLSVPLNIADNPDAIHDLKIKGTLTIHDLSGEFQTPLLRDILSIIAEMHEVKLPKVIRLIEKTTIKFELREGRIFHTGLRFGLPDISPDLMVSSQGSVGIDESLDLTLVVPQILAGEEKTKTGDQIKPVTLRVSGTILEPIVTEVSE